MFKLFGVIMIVVSVTFIFNSDMISTYMEYLCLYDLVKFLQICRIEINMGKTYPQIINNVKTGCFKDFNFDKIDKTINRLYVNHDLKDEISVMFSQLGKKHTEREIEFIEKNIEIYRYKCMQLKEKYDKNHKANFMAGISIGLIVSIVLI